MRQEDVVRNMVKSGPCASIATLIAEFTDGTDDVTSRAESIQTKFRPEGRKWGNKKARGQDLLQPWPLG